LLYATDVNSSESIGGDRLPAADEVLTEILSAIAGYDFVGFLQQGGRGLWWRILV